MAHIRTLRFHEYGEPVQVLRLERIDVPSPAAGRIRAVVHACGLNPADWALCRGLFPGQLPRGIGLDVSGVVDALGAGVTDVAVGDRVVGTADYAGGPSAGASDRAIMDHWAKVPAGWRWTPRRSAASCRISSRSSAVILVACSPSPTSPPLPRSACATPSVRARP